MTTTPPLYADTNIVLCEKDNGSTLYLKKGFRGTIELKGNASTGYAWRTQKVVGDSVKVEKWTFIPSETPPFFVGGGGVFRMNFEVVSEGKTSILLVYDTPLYPRPVGYDYFIDIDVR